MANKIFPFLKTLFMKDKIKKCYNNNNNNNNNNHHHHLGYYDTLDNNKNFDCLIIYFVGQLLMCTLNYQN